MLRYEWKKMLWYRKGLVYIGLFLVCKAAILCLSGQADRRSQEQYRESYGYYMEYLEGELTEEKKAYLEAESLRLSEAKLTLSQVQNEYYSGKIDIEEYREQSASLEADLARQGGFQEVFDQYIYIRMAPENRYFLDVSGWDSLLSGQKTDYLGLLLLLVLIAPVFCQEYSCGMDQLLITSGRGARSQVWCKALVCVLTAAAVGAAGILMEYGFHRAYYGLPCGRYPIQSLECYGTVEKSLSLQTAFWLQAGMKLFGYIYCGVLVLFISSCARKLSVSLLISTAVTMMPFLMVENENLFTRIPGPWGPLVGTVFLSGTEYVWNDYWQMKELVSTELAWGEWIMVLTESVCVIGAMIAIMKKTNGNRWLVRGKACSCFLLLMAVGLLSGCAGIEKAAENASEPYYYNSSEYLYGETTDYLFYYLLTDNNIICEEKETGERFAMIKDALYHSAYDGATGVSMDNTIWLSDSVFTTQRYAYYFRWDQTFDYWNASGNSNTLSVIELDTWDFSERVVLELYVNNATRSLMGLRSETAVENFTARCFVVDQGEVYLMPYDEKVYRLSSWTGLGEPLVTQETPGNIACDGEFIYYLSSAGLLTLYEMETGENRIIEEVVADDFLLREDGIYYLNLRDHNCIYRWNRETGENAKLGDIPTLWLRCDTEYVYFVDEDAWHLYRMDKDGDNVVLVTEEYPVVLYVFDGVDRMYMTASGSDGMKNYQIDKQTLEITEMISD